MITEILDAWVWFLFLSSSSGPRYDDCNIAEGVQRGQMNDKVIEEASGLAVSGRTPDVLWTITDHGGPNVVYAISEQGKRIANVMLEGAENEDWEDIAVNVEDGMSFVYVADTGDNKHDRPILQIYKFPEPDITNGGDLTVSKDDIHVIEVSYPDFKYDSEALAVDPDTKDIFIFTKDRERNISEVFVASQDGGLLENIGTLPLYWVTGADISPSGTTLALTNKWVAWSYRKPDDQSWVEYLASDPTHCNLILEDEEQRESIAVTDSGYWTTSECKDDPPCPLWFYGFTF